jgi:ABC-type antimicrobial peptide transport system permease subunit
VVEDGKYRSLGETPSPTVFENMEQDWRSNQTLVARSPLQEEETVRVLRRAVAELDPSLTIYGAGSLTSELALALFPAKLVAVVLASFGLLAVVLAATGVYGIMAYAVSRRTREIGIRMALGAAPSEVLRLILSRTAVLVGVGSAVGLVIALAAGKFFSQILYGVSARDPLTYICAVTLMAAVALVACWVPARRAIRVEPLCALRAE